MLYIKDWRLSNSKIIHIHKHTSYRDTHSILKETNPISTPIASIDSNKARIWAGDSGSSLFNIQEAVELNVRGDGLQLLSPL